MSFRTAELAIKLEPMNDVEDNGYKVLILCAQISADHPERCGGTNPEIMFDGALAPGDIANLLKLQEALQRAMALVNQRLTPPTPQPAPVQPGTKPEPDPKPRPNASQPTA